MNALDPLIHAHAVHLVHHVVALFQVGKGLDALAAALAGAGLFVARAVNIGIADHIQRALRPDKAARQRLRGDVNVPVHARIHAAQGIKQALAARLAAGKQVDFAALLPPMRQIARQIAHAAVVLRRVQGGYFDRLSLLEARQIAQELLHGQHIAGVHRVQRLLHGAQRALLLGQRHFALDSQGQVGQKAADAVVHACAAAVGRID